MEQTEDRWYIEKEKERGSKMDPFETPHLTGF